MVRPRKPRLIRGCPRANVFKPMGIPARNLEISVLTSDQFEALRLADLEGLSQAEAAEKMNISRATFGRIINEAHRLIADGIVNGKAIKIEGNIPARMDEVICPDDMSRRRGRGFGRGFNENRRD